MERLRRDLISGFLVFIIALPLCLGISMASGFPPVSGILTAVIGGLLSTFVGSARLTIKGPAAGLIVIALGAVQELGGGDVESGYRRACAAIVVAAAIQIAFALLRAGALGDFFPSSVVHGMLAAIGIIICSKQVHTLMGVAPKSKEPLGLLLEIPASISKLNPEIFVIGVISLAVLFGYLLLPKRFWLRRIPAPLLVLLIAVPLGLYFDLSHEHTYTFEAWHHGYRVGPKFLVTIPGSLLSAVSVPDFSVVTSASSIKYVAMFSLVGSLESLLSAKAVDRLDPLHRRSDLDRDLLAVGVGNFVAGVLGGLPMISEIVRSSANIDYGAQSRRANFFHGVFLLLFVAFAPGLIHRIPLAALAGMLIYTGVRLASPGAFVQTFRIGKEQLAIFVTTIVLCVATDLLLGVASGIALKIAIHLVNGAPIGSLFSSKVDATEEDGRVILRARQAVVFSNYLGIKRRLGQYTNTRVIVIDFEEVRLVDHTVMEKLHELREEFSRSGRSLEIKGFERHKALSAHPLAARKRA